MKTTLSGTMALVALTLGASIGNGGETVSASGQQGCAKGDRGRLIRYEKVASHPTAAAVRAYFDEWIAFYQDFYQFPADIPVTFSYGFDSYKLTYCTVDAVLPGRSTARPTIATGMVSVPRKSGPLSTVVYLHGTSVSFYDAVSNPTHFRSVQRERRELRRPAVERDLRRRRFHLRRPRLPRPRRLHDPPPSILPRRN